MSEFDKSRQIELLEAELKETAQSIAAKDKEIERIEKELEKQSRIAEDTNAKLNELLKIVSEDREERKKLLADNEALAKALADERRKIRNS